MVPPTAGNVERLVELTFGWAQALSKRCTSVWLTPAPAVVSVTERELRTEEELKREELGAFAAPDRSHHEIPPPPRRRGTGDCEASRGQMGGPTKQDTGLVPVFSEVLLHAGHMSRYGSLFMFKTVSLPSLKAGDQARCSVR